MVLPRNRLFWAVSIGHLTHDIFSAMGPVVLAFMSATILPMTNTQIGFAVSMDQLLGAVSQPFFGIIADRTGGRWVGTLGLVTQVVFFTLSVIAAVVTHQYWLMFLFYVLRSFGSGAIHPVGSLHAAEADERRSATNTALFFMMGQSGLALGPALAGIMLDAANPNLIGQFAESLNLAHFGLLNNVTPIILFSVVCIPTVLLMASSIPNMRIHPPVSADKPKTSNGSMRDSFPIRAFAILGAMVILRGIGQPGSVAFFPVLFQEKGWDPAAYGAITSSFWIASAISGVIFGQLADRYDRRKVMMLSMVISAPAFFFLPVLDGLPAFMLAIAAGGFSGGSHSIIVVMAQQLIPARKGFASGAILGFIFGTGALGSFIIGGVSDAIGLPMTFQWVAIAIALAGILSMFLPKQRIEAVDAS